MESVASTMKSRVFCKDCKFYSSGVYDELGRGSLPPRCINPKFIKKSYNPVYGEVLEYYWVTKPGEQHPNINMDCSGWHPIEVNKTKQRFWFKVYLALVIIGILFLLFV